MENKVEHIQKSGETVPINLHPEIKDAEVIDPMAQLDRLRDQLDQLPSMDPTQQPDIDSTKILKFTKSKSHEKKEGKFDQAATWLSEQLHKFKEAA